MESKGVRRALRLEGSREDAVFPLQNWYKQKNSTLFTNIHHQRFNVFPKQTILDVVIEKKESNHNSKTIGSSIAAGL